MRQKVSAHRRLQRACIATAGNVERIAGADVKASTTAVAEILQYWHSTRGRLIWPNLVEYSSAMILIIADPWPGFCLISCDGSRIADPGSL
jgi:hypothetical protein